MLQNEVSKAKGPIELFDTEPKPQDRPRRATAPEEGTKKTAAAQEAHEGMSDALLSGERAAPGLEAECCDLPVRETHEKRELIDPPPRARAAATGDGSVTAGAPKIGHAAHSDEKFQETILNDLKNEDSRRSAEEFGDQASGGSRYGLSPPPAEPMPVAESPPGQQANHLWFNAGGGFTVGAQASHRDRLWRDLFPAEQIAPVESPLGGLDTGFDKDRYHNRFFTPRGGVGVVSGIARRLPVRPMGRLQRVWRPPTWVQRRRAPHGLFWPWAERKV